MLARFLGEQAQPVAAQDMFNAQTLAELGKIAEARAALARAKPLIDAMPPGSPLQPQFELTRAVIALKAGNKAEAQSALDKAEAGFKAMGPGGGLGITGVAKTRERVAKLP